MAQLNAGPLQKQEEALEFARKARELAPNDAAVTALLGRIAYDAGNYTWAFSLLQESGRGEGVDPATLHRYAWAAYSQGRVAEAEAAMRRERANYTEQYKQEALELWRASGRSAARVAAELGIRPPLLYRWANLARKPDTPQSGRKPKQSVEQLEAENQRLRHENAKLLEQREVLKKSLGILSEAPPSGMPESNS